MAENVTPVTLEVKDFAPREVLLVDYKFNQATDREGQISGIPRGGRVNIRTRSTGQTVRSTTRTSRSYARSSRTAPSPSRILGSNSIFIHLTQPQSGLSQMFLL